MTKKKKATKDESLPKEPSFAENSELARYVSEDDVKKGNRVSSAAFIPNPGDSYLSVNSLELESMEVIASYYRKVFQDGSGKVAIACRKIYEYNSEARRVGISITFNEEGNTWEYNSNNGREKAYKHYPVTYPKDKKSYSHCGVEYINNALDELTQKKIATRLAGNRPHLKFDEK